MFHYFLLKIIKNHSDVGLDSFAFTELHEADSKSDLEGVLGVENDSRANSNKRDSDSGYPSHEHFEIFQNGFDKANDHFMCLADGRLSGPGASGDTGSCQNSDTGLVVLPSDDSGVEADSVSSKCERRHLLSFLFVFTFELGFR